VIVGEESADDVQMEQALETAKRVTQSMQQTSGIMRQLRRLLQDVAVRKRTRRSE
jgi:hypothetical protein